MDLSYIDAVSAESYRWLKQRTQDYCVRMRKLGVNMSHLDGNMGDLSTQYTPEYLAIRDAYEANLAQKQRDARLNQEMMPQEMKMLSRELKALEDDMRRSNTLDMRIPVSSDPSPSYVKAYLAHMDKTSGVKSQAPRTEDARWKIISSQQQYWLNKR